MESGRKSKAEQLLLAERDILLHNGIATSYVDSGGVVRAEGIVTTYQKNQFGAPDISYLMLNTPMTLSYIRFALKARLTSKYGRHKLGSDGTRYGQGQAIATPKVVKAEIVGFFRELEERAIVENPTQFLQDLIVERNKSNPNRMDVLMSPDLVNQLQVIAIKIQYLL